MLTLPEVRRYSAQSGLRDMMIAEKEIVLTLLLQLLSERGLLDRLAFKGGRRVDALARVGRSKRKFRLRRWSARRARESIYS